MAADPHEADPGRVVDPGVLADRRARRAELAETGLLERAERAEQAATSLAQRLAEVQGRLSEAEREREDAAAALARTESALTVARQREYAEQALRVEAEGEAGAERRRLEGEVTALRLARADAEHRAEELHGALAHVREELAAVRGAALADAERALDAAAGLDAEVVAELQARVERVGAELAAERRARDAAEAELAAEQQARSAAEAVLATERGTRDEAQAARDAAATEVGRLTDEVARGKAVHAQLTDQLRALRAELDTVTLRAGADDARAEDARRTLGEVAASTADLRGALAGLETEAERTRAQLAARDADLVEARSAVRTAERRAHTREAELVALREELERRGAAVGAAQAAVEAERDALARHQHDADAAQAALADADERLGAARSAFRELEVRTNREREQFTATLATSEREHQAALARVTRELEGRAEQERAALRGELTAAREELSTLRATAGEQADARARLGALERAAREAEAARGEGEQRVAAARERIAALEAELSAQAGLSQASERDGARIEALAARLRTLEAALSESEHQLQAARAQLAEAEAARDAAAGAAATDRARADAAEQARELLLTELAERAALEDQVRGALASLRVQLDEERVRHAGRAEQDAAIEALVAELVETSEALRAGYEHQLADLANAHEAQLAAERQAVADELAATEVRVTELREQLLGVATRLQEELDAERTARWVAEEELARERDARTGVGRRGEPFEPDPPAADLPEDEVDDGPARPLAARLAAGAGVPPSDHPALRQTATDEPTEGGVVLDIASAAARLRDLSAGLASTRPARSDDEGAPTRQGGAIRGASDPRGHTPGTPPLTDEPLPSDAEPLAHDGQLPADTAAAPRDAPLAADAAALTTDAPLLEPIPRDAAQAAGDEPLSADIAPVADEALPADSTALVGDARSPADTAADDPPLGGEAAPADDPDGADAGPADETTAPVAESPGAADTIVAERPLDAETLGLSPQALAALTAPTVPRRRARREAAGLSRLEPTRLAAPTATPWLGAALARLAQTDPAAAERVLVGALAAQAEVAPTGLVYGLALPTGGMRRIALAPGRPLSVTRAREAGPEDAELTVEGPLEALVGLVSGGGQRKLAGARVGGKRRRLRKLLKAMRRPVGLPELARAGAAIPASDLLRLLTVGAPVERDPIPPVAYVVTTPGRPDEVCVVAGAEDGTLAVTDGPGGHPVATVRIPARELPALLAGQGTARVAGDAEAVRRLHVALLHAQG